MIATALVFALGALVASFVALVFAPILWSNAQRLARREFEATIPASVREMRGEIDAVRARAAFEMRQEALRQRAAQETAVRERAEAGRAVLENGQLLARQAELERQIADSAGRTAFLEEQVRLLTAERDGLLATRQDLGTRLDRREQELAGLTARYQALSQSFDEQRFRLAKAEARIAELSATQRAPTASETSATPPVAAIAAATPSRPEPASTAAVEQPTKAVEPLAPATGNSRLRAAIARTNADAGKPISSGADHAEIRERISDIAARVIFENIKVEGENSPVARLIANAPPPSETGEPLLADRVRQLQAENAPVKTAPAKGRGAGRSPRKSRR